MRIAITGAGGLIGNALRARLTNDGHEVIRIGRYNKRNPPDVRWSVLHAQLNPTPLEGLDAVVHLAGEPIVGKWTHAKKQAIRDSRVDGTRLLASTLAALRRKPKVLISASAIGYYGDRGDDVMDESSAIGGGFLPDVSRDWEAAAQPAADAGIRVVHPRLGVVLSKIGGALKQMLPIFKLGLGGPLGSGAHWMSWIGLDDTAGAILHLIQNDSVSGPVNLVAPKPVTNREFTRTLASKLRRPAVFPAPRFALRLAFGELADAALLASQRVQPGVLEQSGYTFAHPTLEAALRAELG
jgi:uncharacterized protein